MIVSLDWEKPCHCSLGGEASFVHCAEAGRAGQSWQVARNECLLLLLCPALGVTKMQHTQ